MKKITTLFRKDPNDLSRVINEINPENEWVIDYGIGTRKYDGTACAIIDGDLYKRYDAKKGKSAPIGAIPCQNADPITGHHPHWVKCDRNDPSNKYHFEAFDKLDHTIDGTYELCGEKIQGNPERLTGHELIPHGAKGFRLKDYSFEAIREFLKHNDYEGIVFHHSDPNDERMCKIRKSDFGFKR
jgi:hypothetical protein